jgi:hypothetical protein
MSLISQSIATFETAKRIAPGAVVSVAYKGRTASGLRASSVEESMPSMSGNKSTESGSIQVARADLDRPTLGDCATIDGKEVFITNCISDVIGAFYVLNYQSTKPNLEDGL